MPAIGTAHFLSLSLSILWFYPKDMVFWGALLTGGYFLSIAPPGLEGPGTLPHLSAAFMLFPVVSLRTPRFGTHVIRSCGYLTTFGDLLLFLQDVGPGSLSLSQYSFFQKSRQFK